jgi:hypothetical protein
MTNDDGRKPEGAPERSPKDGAGAPSGVERPNQAKGSSSRPPVGQRAFTLARLNLGVEQFVGPKRFSVQRKMAIVARLLRGEPLEPVVRKTNVSIARLTEWRERALAGAAALKERDDRDDEIARLKSKVGEITMDTNCSTPRSRPWGVNALWPTGGRDARSSSPAMPTSVNNA